AERVCHNRVRRDHGPRQGRMRRPAWRHVERNDDNRVAYAQALFERGRVRCPGSWSRDVQKWRSSMRFASLFIAAVWLSPAAVAQPGPASVAAVEEIYVARSLRESRVPPTAYCAQERIGFGGAVAEDEYTFHSIVSRVADARVTNAKERTV